MTWRDRAACIGSDPDLFFGSGSPKKAKLICADCRVKVECLEDTLHRPDWEDYAGIRGGLGPDRRRSLRKKRRQAA